MRKNTNRLAMVAMMAGLAAGMEVMPHMAHATPPARKPQPKEPPAPTPEELQATMQRIQKAEEKRMRKQQKRLREVAHNV